MAASNKSNDRRARDDTRGGTAKDYIVRKDPDIRGVAARRREEQEREKRRG